MTVTELRQALAKLEAEGKGGLPVTDWEHSEIDQLEIAEETRRGYGIKPPFVVLSPT